MRRWVPVLLLPMVVLAACGDDGGDPTIAVDEATTATTTAGADTGGSTHSLDIEDNGVPGTVVVGDSIIVNLETCPSCGYHWAQMGDAGTGGLELVSTEEVAEELEEGAVGGMATFVATFEATAPGESTIAFGYIPPGDDAPEEVFSVDVTIEEPSRAKVGRPWG
jgi:predicted secreted protein